MFGRLLAELAACGGEHGGWALIGSAAMAAAGIEVVPADVDVFCRPQIAEAALSRGWGETRPDPDDPPMLTWHDGDRPVAMWSRWRHRARWARVEPTVEEILAQARRLPSGVWVMDLRLLATWKLELLRAGLVTEHRQEKDRRHLGLLVAAGYLPYRAGPLPGLAVPSSPCYATRDVTPQPKEAAE